jgi:hypothetical protein
MAWANVEQRLICDNPDNSFPKAVRFRQSLPLKIRISETSDSKLWPSTQIIPYFFAILRLVVAIYW